jgi:hypothetical protein
LLTSPLPGISPGTVDFLADTTRATVNLVVTGCLSRFPQLKIVLSHRGGYVPYAASRIACGLGFEGDETAVPDRAGRPRCAQPRQCGKAVPPVWRAERG